MSTSGLTILRCTLLIAVLMGPSPSAAADFVLQRITDNTVDDSGPRASGSNIAWYSIDAEPGGGSDFEIFFWNGSVVSQITHNTLEDDSPRILGSSLVWQAYSPDDPMDTNIYYWSGSDVVPLATSPAMESGQDIFPGTSGPTVSWQRGSGVSLKIFSWDGVSTTSFSPGIDGYSVSVSGSNYAWYAVDPEKPDGSNMEIFFFDGNTTTQVTHNTIQDFDPIVSGSNIAWWGSHDTGDDLYYWSGSGEPIRLTDERTDERAFSLDGSTLVWSASVGGAPWDIFLYDGSAATVTRITDDFALNYNPDVSGSTVVWSRMNVGETDTEIYRTSVPEPSAFLAMSSALGILLLLSRDRASAARH